jgi:hypothetical protein
MNHSLAPRGSLPAVAVALSLAAALGSALGAGGAAAQTRPPVTDAAPPPAESRDSAGAIVLDHAPVRAQRASQADPAAATRTMGNTGAARNVGDAGGADKASHDAERAQILQRMREDLASQREAEARELRERGAGGLISR